METNNEKNLRTYVQPEAVVVELANEGVICQSTLEPGHGTGEV